jgi:2-hydroxycyclohexanecarboxyl-CoA dehydrogenase
MTESRIALITGAAGGMGSATVKRFVEAGYKVAAVDQNRAGLEAVKTAGGDGVQLYPADMTGESTVRGLVGKVERELGPIDAVANLIGWAETTKFLDENSAYWQKVIAVNFLSAVYLTHAVLPAMIERKRGKLVYVTSDAGRVGQSGEAVYAGMKGGLIAFAKSIAREVARYNICVNCTAPGPTDTPLEHAQDPDVIQRIIKKIPFRRWATPDEQAGAILFLCSKDANYITGQVLSVSGGLTMA